VKQCSVATVSRKHASYSKLLFGTFFAHGDPQLVSPCASDTSKVVQLRLLASIYCITAIEAFLASPRQERHLVRAVRHGCKKRTRRIQNSHWLSQEWGARGRAELVRARASAFSKSRSRV